MNNIEWTRVAEAASFEDKPEQLVKVKRDDIFVVKVHHNPNNATCFADTNKV